jgi:colanic acid/amylovoran biosynthesis glycosyltransferase
MAMNTNRTVIVYRHTLLFPSETYIRGQTESLSRFRPLYVGLRRAPGLSLPESQVHLLCRNGIAGKVERARFRYLGPSLSQQRKLTKESPTLIHAHFGPDGCEVVSLARALGIPLVVTLHGYEVTTDDDHLSRWYLRRRDLLKASGARFICVSDFMRRQALARGFPAEKVMVHYTGIDTDFFRPDPDIVRRPIVLFVGRLCPKKGCEYLIRAMTRVQEAMSEVKLVVIGDGPLRKKLEEQAAALLHNFEFLGVQSPEVIKYWMNCAKVFSTPSVIAETGDAEGFGMVFAEAQAMGLPVVSFATGGIPEAVAHEQTGFLVSAQDWEALAAKLLLVLQNHDLWNQFSEAGPARVKALFNIRKQATILETIYETVLTDWNPRADTKLTKNELQHDHVPVEGLWQDSRQRID